MRKIHVNDLLIKKVSQRFFKTFAPRIQIFTFHFKFSLKMFYLQINQYCLTDDWLPFFCSTTLNFPTIYLSFNKKENCSAFKIITIFLLLKINIIYIFFLVGGALPPLMELNKWLSVLVSVLLLPIERMDKLHLTPFVIEMERSTNLITTNCYQMFLNERKWNENTDLIYLKNIYLRRYSNKIMYILIFGCFWLFYFYLFFIVFFNKLYLKTIFVFSSNAQIKI